MSYCYIFFRSLFPKVIEALKMPTRTDFIKEQYMGLIVTKIREIDPSFVISVQWSFLQMPWASRNVSLLNLTQQRILGHYFANDVLLVSWHQES